MEHASACSRGRIAYEEDDEGVLRDKCGVIAVVASSDAGESEVASILGLGMVALQHR